MPTVDRPEVPRLAPLDPHALDCLDTDTLRALLARETRLWAHIARLHAAPWWSGPYPEELRPWLRVDERETRSK